MTRGRRSALALASLVLHATGLTVVAWLGGAHHAAGVVSLLVVWQWVESRAAPVRPDTADASARAIGAAVLALITSSLLWPGPGHPAGLALVVAGASARVLAIRTLGPAFLDGLALRPTHEVIRRGPYRWLDHPADLGLLLIAAGVVVATGSRVGALVALGILLPLLSWRTRAEDALLSGLPSSAV